MKWVQEITHSCFTLRYDGSSFGKFYSGCLNCAPSYVSFRKMQSPPLQRFFLTKKWVAQLAYLADVFNSLSTQGGYASVLDINYKIKTFRGKLRFILCVSWMESSICSHDSWNFWTQTISRVGNKSDLLPSYSAEWGMNISIRISLMLTPMHGIEFMILFLRVHQRVVSVERQRKNC